MADRFGKTEPATQRRLDKARKEGQFASARELMAALQFVAFLVLLGAGGARWFKGLRDTARSLFARAFSGALGVEDLTHIAWRLFWSQFLPLALAGMALVLLTLAARLVTTRFGWSLKKLAP